MNIEKNMRNVPIEDAKICFRNFSGKEGQFNAKGQRNFCVILRDDIAESMKDDGWNVKYLRPRDETEQPQPYIQVKVNFRNVPPKIVLVTSHGKSILDEESVGMLDWAEIETADVIFSPYPWEVNGKRGITAYLKTLYVTLVEDAFESKYYSGADSAQDNVGGCGYCDECDGHCGNPLSSITT